MEIVSIIYRNGFARVEKVRLPDATYAIKKTFDPTASTQGPAWGFGSTPSVEVDPALVDELRKRFVKEIKVQSILYGEGLKVLPVLDSDVDGEAPWFLMPVADRHYGEEIIKERGSSDPISIAPLLEIADALEELHALGFIHRDLKPQNILFFEGAWRLADFGLVGEAKPASDRLTNYLSQFGTPPYVAPEQYEDFANATAASDIYSFGCIVHDLFFGDHIRVPYNQHGGDGPFGELVHNCTFRDPTARIESSDMRSALVGANQALQAVLGDGQQADQPSALDLVTKVPHEDWGEAQVATVVDYAQSLTQAADPGGNSELFQHVSDDHLRRTLALAPDQFDSLTGCICAWAHACTPDAANQVAELLESVFELGSPATQAQALLAMARVGRAHDVFYAKSTLTELAGTTLSDLAAQRVSIEIRTENLADDFRECLLGADPSGLHPRIAKAISQ